MAVGYYSGMTGNTPANNMTLYMMLSMLRDDPIAEVPSVKKQHWTYHGEQGPDHWHMRYPMCGGNHQSPVNILTSQAVYDASLTDFRFTGFEQLSSSFGVGSSLNFTNTGHAATVMINADMYVEGGGLPGRYKTAEFHFHWGDSPLAGSEHAIDGQKFPLEMHVVNFNVRHGTLAEAMEEPDGLAVLSVLFEDSQYDNPDFAPMADALQYIHKAGDYQLLDGIRCRNLIPADTSKFWRYAGSLTTPRCYETVTWTVFAQPQKISERQVSLLRNLLHESGHDPTLVSTAANNPSRITHNCRPLQPLNGRRVSCSFSGTSSMSSVSGSQAAATRLTYSQPVASTGVQCPQNKGYTVLGTHQPPLCVRYVSNPADFATAERVCAADGGHLAHVKTERVWNSLNTFLIGVDRSSYVWVGADDRRVEGQYQWSDGTRLDIRDPMWDPYGVEDFRRSRDCVAIRAFYKLLQSSCTYRNPFFCQIDM